MLIFFCFVKNDRTLLQIAASHGHGNIVEFLLEKKNVDVNTQDKVCVASLKNIYCWNGVA